MPNTFMGKIDREICQNCFTNRKIIRNNIEYCIESLNCTFFPVVLFMTDTFSSPVNFFQSNKVGSTLGRLLLGADKKSEDIG